MDRDVKAGGRDDPRSVTLGGRRIRTLSPSRRIQHFSGFQSLSCSLSAPLYCATLHPLSTECRNLNLSVGPRFPGHWLLGSGPLWYEIETCTPRCPERGG